MSVRGQSSTSGDLHKFSKILKYTTYCYKYVAKNDDQYYPVSRHLAHPWSREEKNRRTFDLSKNYLKKLKKF